MNHPQGPRPVFDVVAIAICTLAWGTTWFAITLQLGVVDPVVSLIYRFGLASILLFIWGALRREPMGLTAPQHRAALGLGLFTFTIDYALVYQAESLITSAVVAVTFAALAFVNMVLFRWVFGLRPPTVAWLAASCGVAGVALLSWGELAQAAHNPAAILGLCVSLAAVLTAGIGNVFARLGEKAGSPVTASTAWGMLYGTGFLLLYAVLTGRTWSFDPRLPYILSLAHLACIGSVLAFLLYFGLARRRGYATASYVSALTPLLAMMMSALFEDKRWGGAAIGGVALVLLGQWLLLRKRKA